MNYKREDPIIKINDKCGASTTYPTETKRIVKQYYELYIKKIEKSKWNRWIPRNTKLTKTESQRNRQSESTTKNLPIKKRPETYGFTVGLYQTFKEELIATLLKLSPKTKEQGILLNSFYESGIILIPKTLQANCRPTSFMKNDPKIKTEQKHSTKY